MGHRQNIRKIQSTPQEKAMEKKQDKSLEGKIMANKEKKKEQKSPEEKKEQQAEAAEEAETSEEVEEVEEAEETTEEEQAPEEATGPKLEEELEAKPEEAEAPAKKEAEEKEVEAPAREKKKEEEEIVEERIYTVPLGKAWIMPPRKRTPRAMRMLRAFMIKHMKLEARKEGESEEKEEPKKLTISNEVNEKMWGRGVEKPPRKIRVRAAVDKEGNVTVHLAEGD
jgi:large subunit ribosomal protein L31e